MSQISCFTLSLKCFSCVPNNCPNMGIKPLLQFPHPPRARSVLLTFLFFPLLPSSYQVLCGFIYSFLMVRYSCLLLAGILQDLCLKAYSWCICGERCSPCPPTPLPSCSPPLQHDFKYLEIVLILVFVGKVHNLCRLIYKMGLIMLLATPSQCYFNKYATQVTGKIND